MTERDRSSFKKFASLPDLFIELTHKKMQTKEILIAARTCRMMLENLKRINGRHNPTNEDFKNDITFMAFVGTNKQKKLSYSILPIERKIPFLETAPYIQLNCFSVEEFFNLDGRTSAIERLEQFFDGKRIYCKQLTFNARTPSPIFDVLFKHIIFEEFALGGGLSDLFPLPGSTDFNFNLSYMDIVQIPEVWRSRAVYFSYKSIYNLNYSSLKNFESVRINGTINCISKFLSEMKADPIKPKMKLVQLVGFTALDFNLDFVGNLEGTFLVASKRERRKQPSQMPIHSKNFFITKAKNNEFISFSMASSNSDCRAMDIAIHSGIEEIFYFIWTDLSNGYFYKGNITDWSAYYEEFINGKIEDLEQISTKHLEKMYCIDY